MKSGIQIACACTFIGVLLMSPLCLIAGVWAGDDRWYFTAGFVAALAAIVGVAWVIVWINGVGEDA